MNKKLKIPKWYKEKSELQKFFYSWNFVIQQIGIKGVFKFPYMWLKLWWIQNKK